MCICYARDREQVATTPKFHLYFLVSIISLAKYVGKVYKMGDNKIVISVPKEYWPKIEPFIGKTVLVSVEEAVKNDT